MDVIDFFFLWNNTPDGAFWIIWSLISLFCLTRYKEGIIQRPRKFFAGYIFGDREEKGHPVVRLIVALLLTPWLVLCILVLTNAIYVFIEGTGVALGLNGSLSGLLAPDEIIIFYYLLGLTIIGKMGFDMMTLVDEFMVRMDVAIRGEEE